ncbi:MAG: SlyX family protein [Paracoccaceae bacterium]
MEDRITRLEEQVAHLTRVAEDLSDVIARQEAEITRLMRRMSMVMQREAERELNDGGSAPLADQRPPHW